MAGSETLDDALNQKSPVVYRKSLEFCRKNGSETLDDALNQKSPIVYRKSPGF